jgi:hypothetical protein
MGMLELAILQASAFLLLIPIVIFLFISWE